MRIRAFAAKVSLFNVFLGIIPCAACICHEYGKENTCYCCACKHAAKGSRPKDKADKDRRSNRKHAWEYHLCKRRLRAYINALCNIRLEPSLPSRSPGISLNCLLISLTILNAALPTDVIVNAPIKNGRIPPINNPITT